MTRALPPLVLLVGAIIVMSGCGGGGEPPTPVGESAVWFASVDGTELGPFTDSELRAELTAGRIDRDASVWREGMAGWEPASMAFRDLPGAPGAGPDAMGLAFIALCERAALVPDDHLTTLQRFAGFDPSGRASSAQARAILDRHADLLADARAGLASVGALGLDYAQAEELLLPHLSTSRRLAKLLRLDAVYAASVDEHPRAVADCAAIARIARQTAHDDVLISSLVSMSITALFVEASEQAGVTSADAPALRESTAWLRGADPFRVADACRVERTFIIPAAARAIRDGRYVEYAKINMLDLAGTRGLYDAAADLDNETARCRGAFDAIVELVSRSRRPSSSEIDALRSRIERGDFGHLAIALALPSLKMVEQAVKAIDRVDPALDRLGL